MMGMVDIVVALALVQFFAFSILVGRARGRYSVKAPAVTGHETFERYYRVQMNTVELLVLLIPGTWMAARYVAPVWVAGLGAIYLVGRLIYLRAYVSDPKSRGLGFGLSAFPALILVVIGLVGAGLSIARG